MQVRHGVQGRVVASLRQALVINFFQYFWPSLLKLGFLQQFITPIVKATKGKRSFMFFTLQQYKTWLAANNDGKGYYIK